MDLVSQLEKIEEKKSEWEVTGYLIPSSQPPHPVLSRCLELRGLELDVQGWTEEYSGGLSDQEYGKVINILDSHAKDEDKHEQILDFLQSYWGGVEVGQEAQELMEEWQDLKSNPMVKKTFLEAGVFFSVLPLITRYSDYDGYTSRVADWIMTDEQRHVRSARLLMSYFSLKGSRKLLGLIEKTIRWILKSESITVQDKWVSRSLSIALSGKCDDFNDDSVKSVLGHFDQVSVQEVKNGYAY